MRRLGADEDGGEVYRCALGEVESGSGASRP